MPQDIQQYPPFLLRMQNAQHRLKEGAMGRNKSPLIVVLIISFLFLSGASFAKERRGAELRIQKIDGKQVRGELITVKEKSLLLLESSSGSDVSVDVADIEYIEVLKKPRTLLGAGLGLLIGGGVGALTGMMFGKDEPEKGENPEDYETRSVSQKALTIGVLFGLIGAVGGGITGASVGSEETIQIQGITEEEIRNEMIRLRFKARVSDFQ